MLVSMIVFTCKLALSSEYAAFANGISSSIIQVFTILLPVTGLIIPAATREAVFGLAASIITKDLFAFCKYQLKNVPQIPWPIMR